MILWQNRETRSFPCDRRRPINWALWKWQAGEEPKELKVIGSRTRNYSGKLAFSPNGKRLVACLEHGDFPIQIWDAITGELLHHVPRNNEGVYSRGTLIFSPDAEYGSATMAIATRELIGKSRETRSCTFSA